MMFGFVGGRVRGAPTRRGRAAKATLFCWGAVGFLVFLQERPSGVRAGPAREWADSLPLAGEAWPPRALRGDEGQQGIRMPTYRNASRRLQGNVCEPTRMGEPIPQNT